MLEGRSAWQAGRVVGSTAMGEASAVYELSAAVDRKATNGSTRSPSIRARGTRLW